MFTEQLSCYSVPLVFMLLFLYQLRLQSGKTAQEPAGRGRLARLPWRYNHIRVQILPVLVGVS